MCRKCQEVWFGKSNGRLIVLSHRADYISQEQLGEWWQLEWWTAQEGQYPRDPEHRDVLQQNEHHWSEL